MSRPDATASAALDNEIILPVYFCFLDILTDPLRANTSGRPIVLSGTGQPNLDGSYLGVPAKMASISDVHATQGGSDTVTAKLSGLIIGDSDLLTVLGNRANWKGRLGQLWRMIRDESRTQQGGFQHYYTGYMTNLQVTGSRDSQNIIISLENYLTAFAAASGANYMNQADYDPGDLSAKAAIALANGVGANPGTAGTGVGGGGFGPQVGDPGTIGGTNFLERTVGTGG